MSTLVIDASAILAMIFDEAGGDLKSAVESFNRAVSSFDARVMPSVRSARMGIASCSPLDSFRTDRPIFWANPRAET